MPSCRSCAAPIRWTVTTFGKPLPVDAAPDPTGNVVQVDTVEHRARSGGPLEVVPLVRVEPPGMFPDGRPRWQPHFATCKQADQWRKP